MVNSCNMVKFTNVMHFTNVMQNGKFTQMSCNLHSQYNS